ncbi:MAG: hypothetical protein JJU41_08820 [Bacteroidetes bacterium]|nr:hypothetical protein [Bacteroidota bacterium]MCH8525105.1 hypothetical protein [Balneolales bacterium]
MNLGIITSFTIGGLLLLSLLVLNNRISLNSAQTTLSEMTRQSMQSVSTMVNHDIRRLGLGTSGNPVSHASAQRLVFVGAQEDNLPATVEWFFDSTLPANNSKNPRERVLFRVVNGDTTRIELGVTEFTLTYFNTAGDTTALLDEISRIRVQMMVESRVPIGNEFSKSFWESDIIPRSLQN